MPNLAQMIPGALAAPRSQIFYAEIAHPAPTSFGDPLLVIFPDWTPDIAITIEDWPAAHGVQLPLVGDAALLVEDERGNRRCVWWDGRMVFATQQSQTYYLTTAASDVPSHEKLVSFPSSPKVEIPFLGLNTGDVLQDYVTEPGVPGSTFLPAGQYEFHVHAIQKAGNQSVQLYAEFWEYDPVGATHVAMIGGTQVSQSLTIEEIEYRLFFSSTEVYAFASSVNRVSVHLRAIVGGTGGANVSLFVGLEADSHVVIPWNLRGGQSTTGTTTGFAAGAGTAMNNASTSTGGIGSTAYTYGDVVANLKLAGFLKA